MLPQIGATELILIAVLALIVVGPKDLPLMMRRLGQFIARMRSMASDFRASFDELATQSELEELRAEVAAMRQGGLEQLGDPDADEVFSDIDADLNAPVETTPAIEEKPKAKAKKKAPAKKAPAKKKAASKKPRARKPAEPKT